MSRKAVFLDIDGTLVNYRGLVPPGAGEAVRGARRNGHLVLLCTGRSTSELWPSIVEIGFDGVVAAAGGYVELGGVVLEHRNVPLEDLRHVVEFFGEQGVEFFFEANSGLYGSPGSRERLRELLFGSVTDDEVVAELERGLGGFVDRLILGEDLLRDDINKVSFLDSDVPIDTIRHEFADSFDVLPASVPMFGANSGEMSMRGVHKASGMRVVLDHTGLNREDTIAFGDGMNDLEMLAFAGVGVAMGTGHPAAKDAADVMTEGPDDDGILNGFRRLGLI